MKNTLFILLMVLATTLSASGATLVHEWKFDGNVIDTSGSGNDGTVTGTETYVDGKRGQAIQLAAGDSVDAAAGTTSNLPTLGTDSCTLNLWMAIDAELPSLAYVGGFGGHADTGHGTKRSFLAFGGDSNDYYFWGLNVTGGGDASFSPAAYIVDGKFHMYTFTYNGVDTVTGYIDGVSVGSQTVTNFVKTTDEVNLAGTSLWGASFAAKFDEFKIWAGELTAQEVAEEYVGVLPKVVSPKNRGTGYAVTTTLQWKPSRNPANMLEPNADSDSFIVYCDPNEVLVRNATYDDHAGIDYYSDQALTGVIGDDPTQTYDPSPDVAISRTYYWRVDSRLSTASEPNDVIIGSVWSFNTDPQPLIVTHPASQVLFDTEDAVFTVVATDPSLNGLSYQWYYSPDNVNDTPDNDTELTGTEATLTISNPLTAVDEGYYYCEVSNTGGTVLTNPAYVFLKNVVNYWQLDGDLTDAANGYDGVFYNNADPNEDLSFVAGKVGTNAIELYGGQGVIATVDEAYPGKGGEMTVTAWVFAASKPEWATIVKNWTVSQNGALHLGLDGSGNALDVWIAQANSAQFNINEGVAFPEAEWQFVAVVADGTKVRLYRNGLEVGNADYDGTINRTIPYIGIGHKPGDTGELGATVGGAWDGKIDDVKVYNYGLTPEEIADEYGQPVCLYPTVNGTDINGDCKVTLEDFAVLALDWLYDGCYPLGSAACHTTP